MTAVFTIASKSNPALVHKVEGNGVDLKGARSYAIQFARARFRIPDPVAVDNSHEHAVRMRQDFLRQFARPMPNLNPASTLRFEDRRFPLYDER